MFQGFYNLTSGILTQNRNQNVISNNMTNVTTPGYKGETYIATTFKEEMMYRTGNLDKSSRTQLGTMAMARGSSESVINFTQGDMQPTTSVFDFALTGPGFFQVQTEDGVGYTRNGSFILDGEGYLAVHGVGRVLGTNGPIQIGTDKIAVDETGRIRSETGNQVYGQLQVVDFANYDNLTRIDNGIFLAPEGGATPTNDIKIMWKMLEGSNVDSIQEMVNMMSSQRNLQSSAQVLKMYDQLIGKIVSEIGRL